MIYIVEDNRRKLSGNTSLFITARYDEDIINAIKTEDTFYFHKDSLQWEVLITSLASIIDKLIYFDDIKLILKDDSQEENNDVEIHTEFKTTPRDYQLDAIKFGLQHDKFMLLDEPGLGKTLEITYIAEELKEREGLEHCLIICGLASLRTNWMKEIQKHSKLDCMMLGARINKNNRLVWDGIPKRVEQLSKQIKEFFIITNIETIRSDMILEVLKRGPNKIGMIALDEGHCAKSWKSTQGQNLLEVTAKHQIMATGTPLLNNPLDTYMLLTWIGKESKKGITRFKNTYCILNKDVLGGIAGFKNLELLQDVIDSCSIRRTKDILNLPEKTIINEELTMSDAQADFYKKVEESFAVDKNDADAEEIKKLAKDACDKINLNTNYLRAEWIRLRQATSCPSVLTSQSITSCKIERAIELAREIISNGDKVVIFSEFKEPVYRLQEALKEYNPVIGTGDISEGEFSANIDKFQNEDKYKVFIGTTSKCGTGITLTKASYMIFIDCPFTWGEFQQATDRVHRIGTNKPVFIYKLICKDTIDEVIDYILNKKSTLSTFVIDKEVDPKFAYILKRCVPNSLLY